MKTHLDKAVDIGGTQRLARIASPFEDLQRIFGEPLRGHAVDVQCEWRIEFDDGTVATIYSPPRDPSPPELNKLWEIGGFDVAAVEQVIETIARFFENKARGVRMRLEQAYAPNTGTGG